MLAPGSAQTAIRISGLDCFVGPPLDMKTVSAEVVWGHIRNILLGSRRARPVSGRVQRKVMIGGQVLKDVTIDIERGSVVCLAGPSGSGKTTMLKVLARKMPPTSGRVELHGRVSSLISVGENLNSGLTAIENIEQHCELMGIQPADSEHYARQIIEFAELERFQNIPVRRYSTGMAMRLSVALALQGEPDILIMDDVLGVGDIAFQQRFVERLLAMRAAGCTMVMALSDQGLVNQLASRVLTLNGGAVVADEPPHQRLLGQHGFGAAEVSWHTASLHPENDAAALRDVAVSHVEGDDGTELDVEMHYDCKLLPQRCRPSILVQRDRIRVFRTLFPRYMEVSGRRSLRVAVRVPVHLLSEGSYSLTTTLNSVYEGCIYSLKHRDAVTFEVQRSVAPPEGIGSVPVVTPKLDWQIEALREGS